ncbi:hypothetical protein ACFL5B_03435 [Candidatus Latescibacterota bacterium]
MKERSAKAKKLKYLDHFNRRNFFKGLGFMSLTSMVKCKGGDSKTPTLEINIKNPRIPIPTVQSIGVTPLVNCAGTLTRLSGSLMPPEVKMAMMKAAEQFVEMDDLMNYVGKRLAELTGAEWGAVFAGACAAMQGVACACMVGTDPEKMLYLPHTEKLDKNECICRSYRGYTRAVWATGMKMIVARNSEEAEAAVNEKTAMIFVRSEDYLIEVGKKYNIPTVVDRAADELTKPIEYLEKGADLVIYSGGKCTRGPQSSGLLLGRKDIVNAAFLNMAPHHAFGRPSKVGKEEIMGLLTAVDLWYNGRDHEAEDLEQKRKLEYISEQITQIPAVTTKLNPPKGLSDRSWILNINWDRNTIKITNSEMKKVLFNGKPRIEMPTSGDGMLIRTYVSKDGDEIIVAKRLIEIFKSVM